MLSSNDIKFLKVRFRNASGKEIFFRLKELLLIWRLQHKFYPKNREILTIPGLVSPKNYKTPNLKFNVTAEDITDLLNGKFFIQNSDLSVCKQIERETRGQFFTHIDWRNSSFDIRKIWEPARLQNITTLLAYLKTNPDSQISERIKKYCANQILDWIQKNPFLHGPHYISVMECGLRIPVLFYSLILLDNLKKQQIERIRHAIFLHAWWIEKRLSLYSSRGNHTVAECVGLVFAGSIFSRLRIANRWFKRGIQLLEDELPHLVAEDGGPKEQTFQYHRFVLDLYWLVINFLDINNLHNPFNLDSRLIEAEKFIAGFQSQNGQLPTIGDSDDGYAIAPGVKPVKPQVNLSIKKIQIFKISGYSIVTTEKGVQLIFDHGPLGMPPLYNHGHADALSVILTVDGKPILVDPGTYQYNGVPEWRRYFKGTRAHNTITIDGRDQSIQETGFVWSRPYQVKLLGFNKNNGRFVIKAEHNGYLRLKEPVWHRRDILFFDESCFFIKDSFKGRGLHEFEINFHMHPEVVLTKRNGWWQINHDGASVYMRLIEDADFSIIRGLKDPIQGWYSPRYGIKVECNVMSCRKKGSPNEIFFTTAICAKSLIDMKEIQDKFLYFD
jgi:hypothetical protein